MAKYDAIQATLKDLLDALKVYFKCLVYETLIIVFIQKENLIENQMKPPFSDFDKDLLHLKANEGKEFYKTVLESAFFKLNISFTFS